jgi:imidazolonepropionase-like amidohydrolase
MSGRSKDEANLTVVHAGRLLALPGAPAKSKQTIVIENGRILAVEDGYSKRGKIIDLSDQFVLPGLIDMHTHVTGVLNLNEPASKQVGYAFIGRPAQAVLDTLPRVKALLLGGFTSIRSIGDPTFTTYALRDAVNEGSIPCPRMFVSEAQISVAGGDFDPCNWCVRLDLEGHLHNRGNYSGVEEARRVVREEVRRGADFIKYRQAGAPAENPNIKMVESLEEIQAVIATAHQLDRKVAVHVNGSPDFLHAVIKAGADTIEHGPLDDKAIALMKERGTAYAPTLLAAKLVDYRFQDASDGMVKAHRAGVPVIFGSDMGIFGPDQLHEEFALMAAAGMAPDQVLKAATVNAAAALGHRGDGLGSIAAGKTADIIAMPNDPFSDIGRLGVPEAISFVMKEGKIFKHKGCEAH